MQIAVIMKLVPDVVEELVLSDEGTHLERGDTVLKANEFDEQALEQALLLKEAGAGEVTVIAAETGDVDEVLYTALAKGAARAIKLVGDGLAEGIANAQYAQVLAPLLIDLKPDLVLCGVQANDDLDGQLTTWLAAKLGWPFATVVAGVEVTGERVQVRKEFAGGRSARLSLSAPAILGIQAAPEPPRYAPISRVRQVMKTQSLEEREVEVDGASLSVLAMVAPVRSGGAELIEGDIAAKAERLVAILQERGII